MNKVILIGNVGKDAEIRTIDNGNTTVVSFPLATSERYRDRNGEVKENTDWHDITVWRKTAETIGKYIKKGTMVMVEGKLKKRSWTDRDGNKRYSTEVVADRIELLSKKQDGTAAPAPQAPARVQENYSPYDFLPGPDEYDDIP